MKLVYVSVVHLSICASGQKKAQSSLKTEQVSIYIITLLAKPVETYTLCMDVFGIQLCGPTGKSVINIHHVADETRQPPKDPLQPHRFAETQWCCADDGSSVQGYACISEQNCDQGNSAKRTAQMRWEQKVPVTAPHILCSWKPVEETPLQVSSLLRHW